MDDKTIEMIKDTAYQRGFMDAILAVLNIRYIGRDGMYNINMDAVINIGMKFIGKE